MKKLTRKNLNALAAVMPILSEIEQPEYVGGALYINSGGEVLGWTGGSYDIVIAESLPDVRDPYESGNFYCQSDEIKNTVIQGIATRLGIGVEGSDLEEVHFEIMPYRNGKGEKPNASANPIGIVPSEENGLTSYYGDIFVNTDSKMYQEVNNYYDLELLLKHEINHIKTPYDGVKGCVEYNPEMSEYEAYKAMLTDSSSLKCSIEYYNQIYQNYVTYYNAVKNELPEDESFITRFRQ